MKTFTAVLLEKKRLETAGHRESLNKLWHVNTMEYYVAVQNDRRKDCGLRRNVYSI